MPSSYLLWRECVFCSLIYAFHTPLHLTHSDASAGAMFGLNKREQRPSGCAETDEHRQEMHVRSLVAVRAFVWPKLWCCVGLFWVRGPGHPPISDRTGVLCAVSRLVVVRPVGAAPVRCVYSRPGASPQAGYILYNPLVTACMWRSPGQAQAGAPAVPSTVGSTVAS